MTEKTLETRTDPRLVRRLAEALDRVLERGLWSRADRLIQWAAPLARGHAQLAERIARLRLRQDRPDAALAVIDTVRVQTVSLRLLRAVCLLVEDRPAEAHHELRTLSARPDAPLEARLLLAFAEINAGDLDAARQALHANLRQIDDPRTVAVLLLLERMAGRGDLVRRCTGRLLREDAWTRAAHNIDFMLATLGMHRHENVGEPADAEVAALAMELIAAEPVIPALIVAMEIEFDAVAARRLAQAIEHVYDELRDAATAAEAAGTLWLMLGRYDVARTWAERAQAGNPMGASAARLLRRIEAAVAIAPAPVDPPAGDEPVPVDPPPDRMEQAA
jgi:tetratricopeptide (TPR) repeat protein